MAVRIVNRADSNISTAYNMNTISHISNDKAKDIYSESDIRGNGVKPNDMLMTIYFNDGEMASFEAKNWFLTFEEV